MIKKLLSIIIFTLLISGCATTASNMHRNLLSLPNGSTLQEITDQLGTAADQTEISPNITRLTYKSFNWGKLQDKICWLYLKDEKLVKKSCNTNIYRELEDYYALGLITKDEYIQRCQYMQNRAMQTLQALNTFQTMEYQRQSLANQEKMLKQQQSQSEQSDNSGKIYQFYETGGVIDPNKKRIVDPHGYTIGYIDE